MLRRDITPEAFVQAVRMAAGPWGPRSDNDAARTIEVRALFETEEEGLTQRMERMSEELEARVGPETVPVDFDLSGTEDDPPAPPAGSEHSLLNEIALLRGHLDISRQHNATRWTEICALRADLERVTREREDAARYRYLKSRVVRPFIDPPDNMWRMAIDLPYPKTATGRTFDETIDAARTAGEGRDG